MKAPGSVFDIECNGLNPTKIHCLSANDNGVIRTTSKLPICRNFCAKNILVGHNIVLFDIPVLEKLAKVQVTGQLVDTLALSWYLYPERNSHGLADWGEEFGVPKPVVEDWEGQPYHVYKHRCEEDVRINTMLWEKQWAYLLKLYGSEEEAWKLIDYLTFKMQCVREQEKYGWKLDVERCERACEELKGERDRKVEGLTKAMPQVPVWASMAYPKKPYKKDGSISAQGLKWVEIAGKYGRAEEINTVDPIKYIKSYKEPNPNSSTQVKGWLYSLGWRPTTFKYVREEHGFRKIPQVRCDGELCSSVSKLEHPGIPILEGLTVLNHRIGILEGFLRDEKDGYLQARIGGLTNTLRLKHRELVNLPGVDKPYGDVIRGCLICPEGYELGGTDMCSLEDNTKRHYMWDHDPEYVKEMSKEGYDPHLSLAVFAGALKEGDKDKKIRKIYKAVNYASVYGAGGATVGRAAGVTEAQGNKLVEAYWKKNWSVKAIAEACTVKKVNRQKWLFNPVSKMWYSLRAEKDRFSTLNQGTGVYCFDTWVKHCKDGGPPVIGQFHDETVSLIKLGNQEKLEAHQRRAMDKTNEELNLNVKLDIDCQYGRSYAEIH